MKVLGIIAEYNPLHCGHVFQLQTCQRLADTDYTLVVLGSDFNQRGAPAIINKYTRTLMALQAGADAVIEMPQFASSASAAYFAASGVSLLAHSGICTHLGFGSECGDLEKLRHYSDCMVNETPLMSRKIKSGLKHGMTYAAARSAAVSSISSHSVAQPNDILAVAYLNALKQYAPAITPVTVRRSGQDYHAVQSPADIAGGQDAVAYLSATAIRRLTTEAFGDQNPSLMILEKQLTGQMPARPLQIYIRHLAHTKPLTAADFYPLLRYSLLACPSLTDIFDISPDYARRLQSFAGTYDPPEAWIAAIKSKNYTWTKVTRSLTHIMLHQSKSDQALMASMDHAPYIRILGFRKNAGPLLKQLKHHCDLPIITKMADAYRRLNTDRRTLFEKSVFAERIYKSVEQTTASGKIRDVYQENPVIADHTS